MRERKEFLMFGCKKKMGEKENRVENRRRLHIILLLSIIEEKIVKKISFSHFA